MKRMKHNLIFTLAIALLFVFQSTDVKASHIMGGDLTFTCLGGNTYMLQLRLFRDCNGISLGNQESVTLTSPSCGTQTFNLNLLTGYPIIITPLCPTEPDRCNTNGAQYGVHEYVYKGPITLTGCWATATDITVSWSSCCRNGAITTAVAGATYISTDLNAGLTPCNNSPDFLNSPVAFFCVNQPVNYSHGASDPDNDVMVFSLVDCRQGAGNSVNYNPPNSGTSPLTTAGGVTIDSQTGALQFTPTITQTAIICILVEEYRNGVKIGEVVRDMQFEIINCNNNLPVASGINGTASATGTTGAYNMTVCAGDTVQFTVDSYDANYQDVPILQIGVDSIEMSWNQAIGGASFTNNGTALPTGTFFWVPSNADAGNNVFTVNLEDQGCPIRGVGIFSYLITVLEKPIMDAGPSQVTCSPGDTVNLNATFTTTTGQTGTFSWTPTKGLENANAQTTDAGQDTTIKLGETIDIEAQLSFFDYYTYDWSVNEGDIECPSCRETTIQPLEDRKYYRVLVTTAAGCIATDSFLVIVEKDRNLFIPNAFSPNSDGNNDIHDVYSTNNVAMIKRYLVFDRWGELVCNKENIPQRWTNFGWDGTFRGQKMQTGVYVYMIEVEFIDGEVLRYSGDLSLFR